jgi:hypothetical protein
MEEITVVKFRAANGSVFDAREDCIQSECASELETHLISNCDKEYLDDSRQDIRYDSMIVDYILANFEDISKIVNKFKQGVI